MPWNRHYRTHYHLTGHYHLLEGNFPYTNLAHIPRPYPAHYKAHVFGHLELQPPQKLSNSCNSCIAFDPYIQGLQLNTWSQRKMAPIMKKNHVYQNGRDENPSTRSTRQIKVPKHMSWKHIIITTNILIK